jgi:hypothetical protein
VPNTDPINIPITAKDTATAEMRKVADSADKLSRKGVTLDVKGPASGGILGKFKDTISQIPAGFAAAGAAIGAGAKIVGDAVNKFQNLALEVGKFSAATGLSTEEASRFLEVAGDLGVSTGNAEKLVGFFNKTVGQTPGILAQYGAQLVKAKDGTTDVQASFLSAVEAVQKIKDPTERAAAATKLFGRGWSEAAELITTSTDDLKESFDSVSDAKVISEDELARAREARGNFDRLSDSVDDLQLIVGQELAPALADAAAEAGKLLEQLAPIAKVIGPVMEGATKQFELATMSVRGLGGVAVSVGGWLKDTLGGGANDAKKATDDAAESVDVYSAVARDFAGDIDVATGKVRDEQRAKVEAVTGSFDTMRKRLNMGKEIDTLTAQLGGAMLTVGGGAQVAADDVLSIKQSIIDVGEYAGMTPIQVQTALDMVDRGEWDAAHRMVQGWASGNPVDLKVKLQLEASRDLRALIGGGGSYIPPGWGPSAASTGAAASSAPVAGVAAVAVPAVTVPATVRVTVNAGMVADASTLARALTRSERSAARLLGPRWRQVAAA